MLADGYEAVIYKQAYFLIAMPCKNVIALIKKSKHGVTFSTHAAVQ